MFSIRTRNPARTHRVDIDGEPAAPDNIRIAGGRIRTNKTHLYAVCTPCEQGRVHFVESNIDPVDGRVGIKCLHTMGESSSIGEVSAVGAVLSQGPDFGYPARDCKYRQHRGNTTYRDRGHSIRQRPLLQIVQAGVQVPGSGNGPLVFQRVPWQSLPGTYI